MLPGLTVVFNVTVIGEEPLAESSNNTAEPSVYFAAPPNWLQFAAVLMSHTPLPTLHESPGVTVELVTTSAIVLDAVIFVTYPEAEPPPVTVMATVDGGVPERAPVYLTSGKVPTVMALPSMVTVGVAVKARFPLACIGAWALLGCMAA